MSQVDLANSGLLRLSFYTISWTGIHLGWRSLWKSLSHWSSAFISLGCRYRVNSICTGYFYFTSFFPMHTIRSSMSLTGMLKLLRKEMPNMGERGFTTNSSVTMNIAGPATNDPPSFVTVSGNFWFMVDNCMLLIARENAIGPVIKSTLES